MSKMSIVDQLGELIVAVILLYVLYEVVLQLSANSPGFGKLAAPIVTVAAAAIYAYAKLIGK